MTQSSPSDEAEIFALYLLLPTKEVYEWCIKLTKADIPSREYKYWIAKLFGVPVDKAEKQLRNLGVL